MTAWEAITVAMVARITSGMPAQSGARRKKGLATIAGSRRIAAP